MVCGLNVIDFKAVANTHPPLFANGLLFFFAYCFFRHKIQTMLYLLLCNIEFLMCPKRKSYNNTCDFCVQDQNKDTKKILRNVELGSNSNRNLLKQFSDFWVRFVLTDRYRVYPTEKVERIHSASPHPCCDSSPSTKR